MRGSSTGPSSEVDGGGHAFHLMGLDLAGLERNGRNGHAHAHGHGEYAERRIGNGRTPFTHLWEHHIGCEVPRVLPDNRSDIIVSSRGQAWVAGPATHADLPALEAGTTLRGLRIHTAWLRSIVGVDANELTDRHIALDGLFSRTTVRRLVDALWADGFDRDLAELLWPGAAADGRVTQAVAALSMRIASPVGVLANSMGLSARHLRRLVERDTGLSPKVIHQVARLGHAIADAGSVDPVNMARVAASCGYSDQAHLSRQVRRFSGLTPSALL